MNTEDFSRALSRLRTYVEREGFKGYDPYDTLNGRIDFSRLGKWGPVLAIQVQKRNPINVRPWLGVKKGYNPKGIGLLLHAYSTLYEHEAREETKKIAQHLFEWLCNHPSKGYSGYCWGYNFDWASPAKYLAAYTPSIVVTGFVGKGIFRYYQVTKDPKALDVLRSSCDFMLRDLPRSVTEEGICYVDLSAQFKENHPGGVQSELLTLYSLVNSLILNIPEIQAVKILIDGYETMTLAGHIDLQEPVKANMLLIR